MGWFAAAWALLAVAPGPYEPEARYRGGCRARWCASRCANRESLPYAVLKKNHGFAMAVCEYGEPYV